MLVARHQAPASSLASTSKEPGSSDNEPPAATGQSSVQVTLSSVLPPAQSVMVSALASGTP